MNHDFHYVFVFHELWKDRFIFRETWSRLPPPTPQPLYHPLKSMFEGESFLAKLLEKAYVIFKMTVPAMVRPASSDFWKAPLVSE